MANNIHSKQANQAILLDTRGLHTEEKRAINRLMNRAASSSIAEVELVMFLVEGTHWTKDDELVLQKIKNFHSNDGRYPCFINCHTKRLHVECNGYRTPPKTYLVIYSIVYRSRNVYVLSR